MLEPNGTITTNNRPDFPWEEKHTLTEDNLKLWKINRPVPISYHLNMDWHHIIPWSVLRNGWKTLAKSKEWDVLAAWMALFGSIDNANELLGRMKNSTLTGVEGDKIGAEICWPKWNLVEGPHNELREDDPGDKSMDTFTGIHVPNNLRKRCLLLMAVNTLLKSYSPPSTENTKQNQSKYLINAFRNMIPFRNTPITRFNPDLWVISKEVTIINNPNPLKIKHPHWKKRT
jgi:hypothetical protein